MGSIRDSRDKEQLAKNNITHILTIHEDPREGGVDVFVYFSEFLFKKKGIKCLNFNKGN